MPSIARWRRGVGLVGLVLALAPAAGTAAAEVPRGVVGADFRVGGGSAATDDLRPAVAWNQADDQYLVVWQDERLAFTRGADIYGQRFTAAGAPLGANFRISGGSAINSDRDPAVAWNQASREYLVVWEDLRNEGAGKGYDIYGQRVGANGALIGSNLRITGVAHATSYAPAVAWNQAHNQYLVVWHDGRSYPTRGYDIYGQRVSAAGALLGGNFRVSGGSATGDDLHPAVSWNPANNQYLVVWHDGRSYASRRYDVYGQRVSAAGALLGGNFRVSGGSATRDDVRPAVAWNQKNEQYLVVWEDWRDSSIRGTDLYGQRVSAGGVALGSNFRINDSTDDEGYPAVAWSPAKNRYMVVWVDGSLVATRGWEIYGQVLAADGTRVGGAFRVVGPAAQADEWHPAVAANGSSSEYLVVWEDGRSEGSLGSDVYGRRVAG